MTIISKKIFLLFLVAVNLIFVSCYYSIEGKVMSESDSNHGIEGVTVVITNGSESGNAVTDEFGRFSAPDLPSDEYAVTPQYNAHIFNPSTRFVTIDGDDVTNVDFYGNVKTKFFIITKDSVINTSANLTAFINHKTQNGYDVIVKTMEEIEVEYSGSDSPEKMRNYLKASYSATPVGYLMIIGSHAYIPLKLLYPDPDTHIAVLSDYYYMYLSGEFDSDADGYPGEYGDDFEIDDLDINLITGRIPHTDYDLVDPILAKIMDYENSSGSFKNDVLIGGARLFISGDTPLYIDRALEDYIIPAGFTDTTLYQDMSGSYVDGELTATATGSEITSSSFIDEWSSKDFGSVLMFAHGNSSNVYITDGDESTPFLNSYIEGTALDFTPSKPAVVFTSACAINKPKMYNCLGSYLLREGFAVSVFGSSQITNISNILLLDFTTFDAQVEMSRYFYTDGNTVGYSVFRALDYLNENISINSGYTGPEHFSNVFGFNIMGDPSVKVGE